MQLIIGNWKMHPETPRQAESLFIQVAKTKPISGHRAIVAPAFIHIGVLRMLKAKGIGKHISFAVQDVYWEQKGAYTGEVSALMAKRMGVEYAIIGHSERRHEGETDEIINKKVRAAIASGLQVILCVGERERDRDGAYAQVVGKQITMALKGIKASALKYIHIAYEPVWSISTTKHAHMATREDVHEMSIFIEKVISNLYTPIIARNISIIYGGSVNSKKILPFLSVERLNGYLVGGASIIPNEFSAIIRRIHGHKSK